MDNRPPRGRPRGTSDRCTIVQRLTVVTFAVAMVMALATGPMSNAFDSIQEPSPAQLVAYTAPATPVVPSSPVDSGTDVPTNPPVDAPAEPIRPAVRYNAYNVPGSGNWNHSVSDLTVEAGRNGIDANMNDPLWVANMEALRALGTRPTIRPDKDAVYARAEQLWNNPDELEAAATALRSQIVDWAVASSDRPFWMQTIRLGAGDASRPSIENVRYDIPQGTYLTATFDNGRVQKLRFESGMAPIIGIKPRPEPAPAAPAATGGSATPSSNVAYDPVWDRLAHCESTERWNVNTGNGYYGGLQFSPTTWDAFGGEEFAPDAHQASKIEQIIVATRTQAEQGWNAWPSCTRRLGITEPPGPAPSLEQPVPAPAPAPEPVVQTASHDTTPPPAPAGGSVGERALAFAVTQDPDPYTWGATGPDEWDCSGLTQWAFREAGINLPRTSREQSQVSSGTRINDPDDLRPGDLVFYNTPVSHVGIYAGDNRIFRASTERPGVAVEDQIGFGTLSRSKFVWAIRF